MRKIFLTVLAVWIGAFGGWGTAHAQTPVVRAVMFWYRPCPHCQFVLANILPPLQQQYGSQLQIDLLEVSEPANYELWLNAIETFQVPYEEEGVPMLFIGDNVLVGSDEIAERLPGLIEKYLATGGVDAPQIPGLIVPSPNALAPTTVPTDPTITPAPTLTPMP